MREINREKLIEMLKILDDEKVYDIDIEQMFILYGEKVNI